MKYLDLLQLLARFGTLAPQAIVIIQRIAAEFEQLVKLFSAEAKLPMMASPFLGPDELKLEQSISDSLAAAGPEGAMRAINWQEIRDLFLLLKNVGALDAVVSILRRMLG